MEQRIGRCEDRRNGRWRKCCEVCKVVAWLISKFTRSTTESGTSRGKASREENGKFVKFAQTSRLPQEGVHMTSMRRCSGWIGNCEANKRVRLGEEHH